MAHKVCIDGTAYEIDGGKAMVGGTVYEIDHGVANVGGTAYEVGFAQPVKVTVTAKSYMIYAQMTVNGVSYHLPDLDGIKEVLTLPIGAEIVFTNTGTRVDGDVYINHADGTKTTGSFSKNNGTYAYKVIGYANIEANYTSKSYGPGSYDNAPVITITEYVVRNDPATITTSSAGYSSNYANYAYIEFTDSAGVNYKVSSQGYALTIGPDGQPIWLTDFVIPAGAVIYCFADSESTYYEAYIEVNGKNVASKYGGKVTYDYIVTGNVAVELTTKGNSKDNARGNIKITET